MQWFAQHKSLIAQLLKRDIESRYRGSVLGVFWSLLTPMLMLSMYTFVFQTVFKARWNDTAGETQLGFAIILFLGLSVHGLLSETLQKAPSLIIGHQNFVKKIVFPLSVLSIVSLLSALFTFCVNFLLLLALIYLEQSSVPITVFMLPIVIAPYLILLLGVSWVLAALGVYLRDIQQLMGALATLILFLSPVFYATSTLPSAFRLLIICNPISFVVESARDVVIYGKVPDIYSLGIYWGVALVVAFLGYRFFERVRPGFADVL